MRYSHLFGKTVRQAPSEATLPSHQLLYKAGFIRDLVAGRYSFLPLGVRVREKIIAIIEEEMAAIGSQRVVSPTLHPMDLWKATNRDQAFGEGLMRLKDRRGAEFALGATAEGVMVDLVNKFKPSYKDLPIVIHQFSSKFRDELRARGGLIRVREFTMKDAYSFCSSKESLERIHADMRQAYEKIAARLELPVVVVDALSGAIGGKVCHEFIYLNEGGEDVILRCNKCDYAANAEKAEFKRRNVNSREQEKELQKVKAPGTITAQQEATFHQVELSQILNTIVYKTADGQYIAGLVLGDHQINQYALEQAAGLRAGELEPATEEDLEKLGTVKGYVTPVGEAFGGKIRFIGDIGLEYVKNLVTGANEEGVDYINANLGRDFNVELLAPIAQAKNGDPCPVCDGILNSARGIEFGHIFQLDHFYTKAMNSAFVDQDGQRKPMWNGSYGIGIGRALACVVEEHHDEKGIVWPVSVAPYHVHLISLGNEEKITQQSEELYKNLQNAGFDVLYDDREESAGIKFADADLIGIPFRVVVSARTAEKGGFEVKRRNSEAVTYLDFEELINYLNKK